MNCFESRRCQCVSQWSQYPVKMFPMSVWTSVMMSSVQFSVKMSPMSGCSLMSRCVPVSVRMSSQCRCQAVPVPLWCQASRSRPGPVSLSMMSSISSSKGEEAEGKEAAYTLYKEYVALLFIHVYICTVMQLCCHIVYVHQLLQRIYVVTIMPSFT